MSSTTTHQLEHTPAIAELTQLDQWVISKYVPRRGKLDKPPFSPLLDAERRKPWQCSHSNPAHWGSYDAACEALRGFLWLGFVFHESDPYTGVDLDGCCKPDRERIRTRDDIEPWALRIIDLVNSYTEISPSGKGVKIFARGKLAETLLHSLGEHKGIEIYSKQRYFTVTGAHLAGTPTEICEAQAALDQLDQEYRPARPAAPPARPAAAQNISQTQPRRHSGRASLDDVKDDFNAKNPLDQLLLGYGAKQTSSKDFSCPFCEHTHANTLFIYNGRIYSRSSTCKIPQKRGLDPFGLFCLIECNNDPIAAAKKLNPIEPTLSRWVDDRDEAERWSSQQEAQIQAPRQRTPSQIADAERKRAKSLANRDTRMARIATLEAQIAADKLCPFDRQLWAHHQQRWIELGSPEYYESNERIARAVLCIDRAPTPNELRRLQLAHGRLIARGYLVRTIRWKPGEKNTNCWQPGAGAEGGMVIRNARAVSAAQPEGITMLESCTDSQPLTLEAHEGGASPSSGAAHMFFSAPPAATADRLAVLSYVQGLAAELGGGGRNYTELNQAQLEQEAARLEQLLSSPPPAAEQPPLVEPEQEAPAGDRAVYSPPAIEPSGEYTGRLKDWLDFSEQWAAATSAIRVRADVVEQPPAEPVQLQLASPAKRAPAQRATSALDRYRADVALMSETQLAGELKKHQRTLKKHAGAAWLASVREKLDLVQAEIDLRVGLQVPSSRRPPPASHALWGRSGPIGRKGVLAAPPSQALASSGAGLQGVQVALF